MKSDHHSLKERQPRESHKTLLAKDPLSQESLSPLLILLLPAVLAIAPPLNICDRINKPRPCTSNRQLCQHTNTRNFPYRLLHSTHTLICSIKRHLFAFSILLRIRVGEV